MWDVVKGGNFACHWCHSLSVASFPPTTFDMRVMSEECCGRGVSVHFLCLLLKLSMSQLLMIR